MSPQARLVSRILVRTINEGSTLVMKAINMNSANMVRKARAMLLPRAPAAISVLKPRYSNLCHIGSFAIVAVVRRWCLFRDRDVHYPC